MDTVDGSLEERTVGKVVVCSRFIYDEQPDYSWIGEYSNLRQPQTKEEKLVHRETESVLDHTGIWRDEKGRIVATPEVSRYSREYQFTFHSNGHERIKYAIADHRRLEALERGDWCFLGVAATVNLDGVEIGKASLWGLESDGEEYLEKERRNIIKEAIYEAKDWMGRNGSKR